MPGYLIFRRGHDVLRGEPEFLLQLFERRRGPEGSDSDVVPIGSGVFGPAEVRSLLDGNPCLDVWRENRVPIRGFLMVK